MKVSSVKRQVLRKQQESILHASRFTLHACQGFTLIELLLVIAIMLTLSVLSGVFYSRFLNQNAVQNASDGMVGALRKAQIYSMMAKGDSAWGVNYISPNIIVFKGSAYATRTVAFDEKFPVNGNVLITGFTEVDYARITGMPSSTPTITLSRSGTTKTITVNGQGVVSR